MLFTLIGFYIILLGLNNLKKGFLSFLIFKLFLTTNIALVSVPGIPLLSLDLFLIIFYYIIYSLREKKCSCSESFPFKIPFSVVILSYFFSTLFAYVGFAHALTRCILTICEEILIIWLIWRIVDIKDYNFLLKGFTISFFFISIYGCMEYFLQFNPLMEYEISLLGDEDRAVGGGYGTDHDARGYRVQSVFEHPIGGGMNMGMYIIFILIVYLKFKIKISNMPIVLITMVLSITCIFFSNSRGPFLFLMICLLPFIKLRLSKAFFMGIGVFMVIALVVSNIPEYSTLFSSFFSESANDDMEGSRFNQLSAAIAVMLQSPLFGLGFKFEDVFYNGYVDDLLRMESIWFFALTTLGLFGVFSYLLLAFYSIIRIPLKYKSKHLFFISLAYWVTASLTSVPGFHFHIYYLILFYIIKQTEYYKKQIVNKV